MQIARYLKEDAIDMDFQLFIDTEDEELSLNKTKEQVLKRFSENFENIGRVNNITKLFHEFQEREKKDSCCIGEGIALPHLRTLQCKDLLISIYISKEGIPFGAFDQTPINLFFAFIAPRFNDKAYHSLYKEISKIFQDPNTLADILEIDSAGELIRFLKFKLR